MTSRKLLRGVVGNFLGTYVSRYSGYGGYWLFGFIVADLDEMRIDLLAPITTSPSDNARDVANQIAVLRFEDQVKKAGLEVSQIKQASLIIQRLSGSSPCCVNGHPRMGYNVKFSVHATTDKDRVYAHERTVTVAPHEVAIEGKSGREDRMTR